MRHNNQYRKLGRSSTHRKALLRNMATSLILKGHIETTLPKAKELRPVVEKLVTLGKTNSHHSRLKALKVLYRINTTHIGNAGKLSAMHRLFEEIAPSFAERKGGYTRIVRTRKRPGDNAQMAIIQFVEGKVEAKEPKKKQRKVVKDAAAAKGATAAKASKKGAAKSGSEKAQA